MRGGDGQVIEFTVLSKAPWTLAVAPAGLAFAPDGLEGGESGAAGHFFVNGEEQVIDGRARMQPGDLVRMETPGGGGFGAPPA